MRHGHAVFLLLLLQGMGAGHIYYYLEDVYPQISGRRVLQTPGLFKMLFPPEDIVVAVPANDEDFARQLQRDLND